MEMPEMQGIAEVARSVEELLVAGVHFTFLGDIISVD